MVWYAVLTIIGSVLVIVSTIVTGYLLDRIDRAGAKLDEDILAIEGNRQFGVDYMQYGYTKANHAQTLLALLQCTDPPAIVTSRWIQELVTDIVELDRRPQ